MANNLKDHLKEVADAIRAKKGTNDLINPQDFATEIEGISGGGESGGSKYHEIKPNGWYWKTTEELKAKSKEDYAVALGAFVLISSFYEAFPEKGLVINFATCYNNVGELGYGGGYKLDYISEAVPDSMMTGTPTSSLRDYFAVQGIDEATFLAQMESMGFISITEEEYMAARAEKN